MTSYMITTLLLSAGLLLSGCAPTQESAASSTEQVQADTIQAASGAVIDVASLFSQRDLDGTYDAQTAVAITLNGDTADCESDAVTISAGQVSITQEGTYLISGTWTDGQIVVNAPDTAKVQLVLSGADITSATSAAIYALEADKVFVTLAEGTQNTLTNGGEYVAIDENNIDAVIFAKTDLTLNGAGSLTINAPAGHGVVSKDDLVVTGGSYAITAASHGLSGKDSLSVADGDFTIVAGKDGLHAENTDDTTLGSLYIADGTFDIDAQGDAMDASGAVQIDGGTLELLTAGGSASVTMTSSDSFGPGGRGGRMAQPDAAAADTTTETTTETPSQKGIKADGTLTVNGGSFTIDAADDCLHAGGDITVAAGEFYLESGDDAVHSDAAVTIQGGTFTILYCYEGIEGLSLTIADGTFDITSYDDGLNAAGGADSSGFGGPRQDTFAASSDSFILISGGTFTIVSQGDCIDSNGDLTIQGGVLDLTCNGSGNTALDTDGNYENTGGTVTTNDGSEENPGGMGGGRQGGGMRPADGDLPADGRQPPSGSGEMPESGRSGSSGNTDGAASSAETI